MLPPVVPAGGVRETVGATAADAGTVVKALAKASAVWKRFAGSLAMAMRMISFSAAGSPASDRPLSESPVPLAPGADMERFYAHLQEVMDEADFKDRTVGGTNLMTRIRRLFQRCEMDQNEVNILRGILTSVQSKRRRASSDKP